MSFFLFSGGGTFDGEYASLIWCQMSRTDDKFGAAPHSSPVPAIAGHFLCACGILAAVHPPFVSNRDGTLRMQTVLAVAVATTLVGVLAQSCDASAADIFRGAAALVAA